MLEQVPSHGVSVPASLIENNLAQISPQDERVRLTGSAAALFCLMERLHQAEKTLSPYSYLRLERAASWDLKQLRVDVSVDRQCHREFLGTRRTTGTVELLGLPQARRLDSAPMPEPDIARLRPAILPKTMCDAIARLEEAQNSPQAKEDAARAALHLAINFAEHLHREYMRESIASYRLKLPESGQFTFQPLSLSRDNDWDDIKWCRCNGAIGVQYCSFTESLYLISPFGRIVLVSRGENKIIGQVLRKLSTVFHLEPLRNSSPYGDDYALFEVTRSSANEDCPLLQFHEGAELDGSLLDRIWNENIRTSGPVFSVEDFQHLGSPSLPPRAEPLLIAATASSSKWGVPGIVN